MYIWRHLCTLTDYGRWACFSLSQEHQYRVCLIFKENISIFEKAVNHEVKELEIVKSVGIIFTSQQKSSLAVIIYIVEVFSDSTS